MESVKKNTITITEQDIHNIIAIMGRASIKGSEAPTFMACVNLLEKLIGKEIEI